MISAYIFVGPSLPIFLIKEKLNLDLNDDHELALPSGDKIKFLPPVSEGDILQLVSRHPKIIGIVDGYFGNMPSIWHKEILLAMAEGIHVMGAASLGALRAVELELFGMDGVGAIFRSFREGSLEDDDEVAVIHGPQEQGFVLLSEAMVNIRATLEEARTQEVLSASEKAALLSVAKQLHYKSRGYNRVISLGIEAGLDGKRLKAFRGWLPDGRKDQKLTDAMELLSCLISKLSTPLLPKKVLYNFEETIPWQRSRRKSIEV